MKISITFIIAIALSITSAMSQTKVLWLKNNNGIVEDSLGSVTLWENQIEGYGDATQSISALGGEEMQETYPGKVNVGFSKDGSFLNLDGTNASVSDGSFSFFYVGKGNATTRVCSLIGNYDIESSWSKISGFRFVKVLTGNIDMQYGTPNLKIETISNISGDDYFFIGFSLDASGNYQYFDSSSPIIKEGKLAKTIIQNDQDFQLNLFDDINGPATYDHTEVVEVQMYDAELNATDFAAEYTRLSTEYADLVVAEFSVSEVLPTTMMNISNNQEIKISFSQNVDTASVLPKVYINKSETEATGRWTLTSPNELTYVPNGVWPYGALVSVKIYEGLKSTDGVSVGLAARSDYTFIVESGHNYGSKKIVLDQIATVDFPQAGHKLPLKLVVPERRDEKLPVHIWVHGGGWSGGSASTSVASYSPHDIYLAENLGIATLGISYRCSGASGTFTLAMEDIATAYQWAEDNADTYNFDMTKVFFSGGSAGAPLAALASQRYPNVIGFIGFNGIYDFVNDAGDFGTGNSYKQNVPSERENSPIFQLRNNPPATIMMHGDADVTISYKQSTLFADQINTAGAKAHTVIYPGEVHAFFNKGQEKYEDVLWEMANFISETLKDVESTDIDETNNNFSSDDALVVFPNPMQKGESLHIQLKASEKRMNAEIVNLAGQTILKQDFFLDQGINQLTLDTSRLDAGNYIMRIVGEAVFYVEKIAIL